MEGWLLFRGPATLWAPLSGTPDSFLVPTLCFSGLPNKLFLLRQVLTCFCLFWGVTPGCAGVRGGVSVLSASGHTSSLPHHHPKSLLARPCPPHPLSRGSPTAESAGLEVPLIPARLCVLRATDNELG